MNTPIKDRIHARALAALRDRWPRCTYCGEKHARPGWTRASMRPVLQAYSSGLQGLPVEEALFGTF